MKGVALLLAAMLWHAAACHGHVLLLMSLQGLPALLSQAQLLLVASLQLALRPHQDWQHGPFPLQALPGSGATRTHRCLHLLLLLQMVYQHISWCTAASVHRDSHHR